MRIFLDGATGYIGSAIARALTERSHDVLAHARSADSAAALTRAGVTPLVGDLLDHDWLRDALREVDGAVHAASPNDATSADFDNAVLDVVLAEFAGSPRPYVHTGGSWIHGSGSGITESTPPTPPRIVAWRPAVLERIRAAAPEVHTSVVAPANLYGHGGGLVAMLLHGPVTNDALVYPGSDQRFANVFVDDAATLFALALENAPAGSYYLAANPMSTPMDELAGTASRLRGLGGRIAGEDAATARNRLGQIADALLLDAQVDAAHAAELGWRPTGPALIEDLTSGSYAATIERATA